MAYKVFTNGSVLNASEVNDNLMNQAVITFTNSTARASAITSPVEGMVTYLADTDTYQFWNGSAWTNLVSSTVGTGNAVINGAFEINQRNFSTQTITSSTYSFGFDRWGHFSNGGSVTLSAQTFTPGTAPVSGYEGATFFRTVTSGQSGAGAITNVSQRIESVRSLAGQAVTISFFARSGSGTPQIAVSLDQNFGSGGSPSSTVTTAVGKATLSTAWTRHTLTVTVPSISGKTIGTTNDGFLSLVLWASAGTDFNTPTGSLGIQSNTFDIWGVQLESGSTAAPFRRNASSLEGELAACQRYYFHSVRGDGQNMGVATYYANTTLWGFTYFPVTMRTAPTAIVTTGTNYYNFYRSNTTDGVNSLTIQWSTPDRAVLENTTDASGTAGQAGLLATANALSSVGFSAEL